ncbi:MAG: long-chain fatty acid--CoA ligase [Bermanella sp.]
MNQLIDQGINSLADFIENSLTQYAEHPAYSCMGQTLTFAQVDEKSRALACWLQQESGLKAGDRIIIQLPNILQYPVAAYAALRAGLVLVNTNPMYTPQEMAHQFKDSGAKAIILLQDLLPKLNAIRSTTSIETVLVCNPTDFLTNDNTAVEDCIDLNLAITKGSELALQPRKNNQLNDTCVLQYTGGTTGVSKGAELTHANILSNAAQTKERRGEKSVNGQEIVICPLPLYHIYAFTVNMVSFFSSGNLNVLIPNPADLSGFVASIKPFKFTAFAGINTLFVGLCMNEEFKKLDFSSLKFTFAGGAALTSDAVTAWKAVTGGTITEGYGLSETAPVLCANKPGHEKLGTVGIPLTGTEIQIWNENNQPVSPGEEGEIVAKGPQVMKGYWGRPQDTQEAIVNGFFKTGDVGKILDNGFVKIVDRLKDMIIVSGFNVYPNEVEDVLTRHPNIMEAAVISQEDAKTGESVCAYIVVNQQVNTDEIITHCREYLTRYKVPKKIITMDSLPKSTVGKILRKELRKAPVAQAS